MFQGLAAARALAAILAGDNPSPRAIEALTDLLPRRSWSAARSRTI